MNHGIYIHIPFCRKKCSYCSFYSVPIEENDKGTAILDSYLNALEHDIESRFRGLEPVPVDTIYFGGGTPSVLSAEQISRIIVMLRNKCSVHDDTEISLEFNPEDVQKEKLVSYTAAGVNRIILGYQTSFDKLHSFIGRGAKPCKKGVLDLFFKTDGFSHCLDIITGIPGQTGEELEEELNLVTRYGPDHISAYQLSIEEGTPLKKRYHPDKNFDDHQRFIMEKTIEVLTNKGYDHYEISNFALNGSYSRHNMKYWSWIPYLGFGPSAHSHFEGKRYYVEMTVDEYLKSKNVKIAIDNRSSMAPTVEYIMTGLRLMRGISITDMEKKLALPLPEKVWASILNQEKAGNLNIKRTGGDIIVNLTEKGLYIANSVIYELVEDIL